MSAAFVGVGFWSAATVVFWCSRQRNWVRARVIVPTVAVVATMLMVATIEHLEVFHGPIGLAWIEVYAIFPPALFALAVMQLASGAHASEWPWELTDLTSKAVGTWLVGTGVTAAFVAAVAYFAATLASGAAGTLLCRREGRFGRVEGAALQIPYAHSGDPLVASLVETSVAELAAAAMWLRGPA